MKINPIILIQRSRNRKMEYRRSFPARLRVTGVCNASKVVASQCLRHVGIPYHDSRVKRIRSRRWVEGGRGTGGETMRGSEWDGRCGGRGNVVRGEDVWLGTETRYISVDGATLFNLQLGPVDCARNAITTAWNPFCCWCWGRDQCIYNTDIGGILTRRCE